MRFRPPPLSVTSPRPSRTTCELVFTILAVVRMRMTTGLGPQENLMIPPARTAATVAAEVQLAAVPCPTTRVGCDVSIGRPAPGTETARTPASDRRGVALDPGVTQEPAIATLRSPRREARRDTPPG